MASDVLGLSGRLMLRALAEGETDASKLAELAQGKLKSKKAELRRALEGRLTHVQRWVLAELLTRVEELEAALTRVEARIGEEVAACADPFVPEAVELLESIPGVGVRTAQTIVAEIGVDMERFPSAKHLASWAGVCPGNHESAGKRKSGQPTKGNQVVADDLGGSGVGRHPCQGHVPPGEVSALSEAHAQAESLGGDRAPSVSDQLSPAESAGALCRTRALPRLTISRSSANDGD